MTTEVDWLGFALAVFLIELSPGPNMAWLAGLSMTEGRQAGVAATAGVAVGLFVSALAAAIGLATVVTANPWLWQILRWGGALFLLWLAWDSWRDSGEIPAAQFSRNLPSRRHFVSGLMVNLLNPKALLFFMVVIPRFLAGKLPTPGEALALAGVSIAIATAVHLVIVFAGSSLHLWLANSARTRLVRRGLAILLVAVAIWFAAYARVPVAA